ncbi:hypothetical protein [Hymenobacter jejuensis]|uniref:Uncharacterized protein n=1 Tax=Hymenobacter jejuensis TaxID=2502781 RepID=A0A5B7ZZG3_9BACT|nr:hypothetical protein [Hymenobacter jejuensis]QDA60400.1 hypothetical protein FHG12_09885 [Hymenobacter jejuensis]
MHFLYAVTLLLGLLSVSVVSVAQRQPAVSSNPVKVLVVSPVVGETIDAKEKATYGLFPYYGANDFREARFVQSLTPDSTITLQTSFRDGSTKQRPFTAAEFQAVRASIADRQQLLNTKQTALNQGVTLADSLGQTYSVELYTGTSFIGMLITRRLTELDFQTKDLGRVTVQKANIKSMQPLTSGQAGKGWEPVGNGTRIFFAPTARSLRKGEGYVQDIDIIFLGANYGITDNISIGALVPVVPGVGLNVFALTPKVGFSVTDKVKAAAGVLFASGFGGSGGIAYGVGTYGTADSNATLGVGYLFAEGDIESSPVILVGGCHPRGPSPLAAQRNVYF